VAAVVLTRNRKDSLRTTLEAIQGQSRTPDEILVVDNASSDGTSEMLGAEFPSVSIARNETNVGAAGGRSRGMSIAFEHDHDIVWFVDDDTTPAEVTLARTLELAARIPRLGMLGQLGGTLVWGVIRHGRHGEPIDGVPEARQVDFVLTDGAIVTRAAYERAGVLDARYFIMMEDVEYPLRVKNEGLIVARAELGLSFHHLGATPGGAGGPSAPWRLYYQTRNHLRMVIDNRSAVLLLGWLYRQVGGLLALALQPDRRRERLQYRWRGTVDGLRNRMGEVVTPPA
jgi:rhamnopyranosyl-N-acetylglucosaminyl-diphospho-decaprenol beta-1,3/1,4-galactofuranosyltransferase